MQVYVQDHGVNGVIIVIAHDLFNARHQMKSYPNYKEDVEIDEYEVYNFEYGHLGQFET